MSSRRTRLAAVVSGAVLASGAIAGTVAATSASAATANAPKPVFHRACAYNLNGGNEVKLTYLGTDYLYPVVYHTAPDGAVSGFLLDKGLPAGHQILRLHGDCVGSDVDLGVNYPAVDPQGQRVEDMNVTPISLHYGSVSGVWTETGSEAGSGAASLVFPIHR
jgi:hypothetical protein